MRSAGWGKALLAPGETKRFTVPVDARLLAEFDAAAGRWQIAAGDYEIALGDSAESVAARRTQRLSARTLPP